ncbi:MAG: hypothetical protein IPJ81_12325 [Chitinophagaceae bacterium]|nr:hypothetical protein [Chitinophagaceae bacterium]
MRWTAFVFFTAISVSSLTLLYSGKSNNKFKKIAKPSIGAGNTSNLELVKLKSIGTTIEAFAKRIIITASIVFLLI